MLDRTATAWLRRLLTWLELFEDGFARQSQRGALRRYVTGLLSDSRRKSMEAMWARLSDPGTYQAFQHFITHAPWQADAVWTRLREVVPDRRGVLILDGTSFPKQGPASVGVARQYCGARGKIANCQTAVTVALWTGARAWLLGATMYLPEAWLTARQRAQARIPATTRFHEKWRLALTLLRQVRAAGFTVTAVVADAEFGDNATLRRTLHRAKLPYALGVSSDLKVFLGTPALEAPPPQPGKGRPRTRRVLPPDTHTVKACAWAGAQMARQWRLVSWRNGTQPAHRARFCAVRVTPAHDWRAAQRLAPEVWLLCERELGRCVRERCPMMMDKQIRLWIVDVLEQHRALLAIAVRQRAKFEGWLKFELASHAAHNGATSVQVETASDSGSRSDLSFVYEGKRYDVELKTCNTNWRMKGVLDLTRPITKNIASVVVDGQTSPLPRSGHRGILPLSRGVRRQPMGRVSEPNRFSVVR